MDFPNEKKPITDIELITCSECGNPTVPAYKDDLQTQWFKCEKGHITNKTLKTKFTAEGRESNLPKETIRKNQWFLGSRYSSDETEKFNPNTFANSLTGHFFFKTDKKTDILYIYNSESGIWEPEGEIFIHQALVDRLNLEVKPHYQEAVEYYIKGESYENVAETPNLIALENGLFDVEKQELLEKSPAYFIISKIPVTYDVNANCPTILKFLIDVFGENQLTALQEGFRL